jgi:multidrug efflux pump subunit AcrA (membrane-fusion protein)
MELKPLLKRMIDEKASDIFVIAGQPLTYEASGRFMRLGDQMLMPGQYTGIRLKQKEITDAISVPAEAIVPEMGKNKVFVYRGGKAEPVDITIGLRTDSEVQVVEGLQRGDTILTSGTLQLRKGSAVNIVSFE